MLSELTRVARDWQRVTDYLLALGVAVEKGQWSEPSGYPGWSNKDRLAHLAEGYVVRIEWLTAAVEGREPEDRGDIDAVNAERIAAASKVDVADIIERPRRNRARVLELIDRLRPEHLDVEIERSGPPPYRQPLRDLLLGGINTHDLEHASDLKRSTGVSVPEPALEE